MSDPKATNMDPVPAPAPGIANALTSPPGADEVAVVIPETPYQMHPSAAAGTTERPEAPEGVVQEFYIGLWSGRPNYGCPACTHTVVAGQTNGEDGSGAIGFHLEALAQSGNIAHFNVVAANKEG